MEIKTILFWVVLAAFVLPTYYFGFTKAIGKKDKIESFKKWGYSITFMKLLGLLEIIAGTGLIFSQTRYIAMLIMAVILVGAVYTHIKAKDSKDETMTPIFVGMHLCLLLVLNLWIN